MSAAVPQGAEPSGPGEGGAPVEVPQADIAGVGVAGGGLTLPVPVVPVVSRRQGRDWLPPPVAVGPFAPPSPGAADPRGADPKEPRTKPIAVVPGPVTKEPEGTARPATGLVRVTSRPVPARTSFTTADERGAHGPSAGPVAGGGSPAAGRTQQPHGPGRAKRQSRAPEGSQGRPGLGEGRPASRTPAPVTTPIRLSEQLSVLAPWTSLAAARRWGWQGRARRAAYANAATAGASSARNAGIMAAGTTLSRLTGFARFLAVAWVLGQGHLADAYNQANTVPNTMYDLLLGGVLSATLLPVLMQSMTRRVARGAQREDEEAVPAVVTALTVFLLAASAILWVAAPLVIDFYLALASGRAAGAEKALATSWLRLFSPQLLFIGLITITTALLNARRRFMAVAFSPVLANIVTIAALAVADHMVRAHTVAAFRSTPKVVLVIGLGTTAGYVVQLVAQIPPLLRAGVPVRFLWRPRHPVLERIVRLSGWTIGAVATNQASFALVSLLANRRAGNYSSFTYSYQFMLLPYSVIAVSIAAAMAPELAELWSRAEHHAFGRRVSQALRATVALILPAAAGYAVLARRVTVLAAAHGALGVHQAVSTGTLLAVFAVGLPGFSCFLLIMRAFQSQQDARSMFWLYVLENGLTLLAALSLYPLLGVSGLVVAWMGSYSAVLPIAWLRLRASADVYISAEWWARVVVATVCMVIAVAITTSVLPSPGSFLVRGVDLLLAVLAGALVYLYVGKLVALPEVGVFSKRAGRLLGTVAGRAASRAAGPGPKHAGGAGAN